MKAEARFALLSLALMGALSARAEEGSNSPYIDSIRRELLPKEGEGEPYTEKLKRELGDHPTGSSEGYTEKLRREDPDLAPSKSAPSYIEEQRSKIESKLEGGAIEAVRTGNSKLKPRYRGEIAHAFGLRYNVSATRDITASSAAADFNQIYGSNYVIDLSLFYEWQFFHSETYGSLGLIGSFGTAYFHGYGNFVKVLPKAWAPTTNFSAQSLTQFQFFQLPTSLGIDYRFNLTHYVRPFAALGPSLIAYFEERNDNTGTSYHGTSKGLFFSGGVNILLDWISKNESWDAYANYLVRHMYLTLEYSKLSTISGDVDFSTSGFYGGVTFEY